MAFKVLVLTLSCIVLCSSQNITNATDEVTPSNETNSNLPKIMTTVSPPEGTVEVNPQPTRSTLVTTTIPGLEHSPSSNHQDTKLAGNGKEEISTTEKTSTNPEKSSTSPEKSSTFPEKSSTDPENTTTPEKSSASVNYNKVMLSLWVPFILLIIKS